MAQLCDNFEFISTGAGRIKDELKDAEFAINVLKKNLRLNEELLQQKDEEIALLHSIVNEAIHKPMGVEPHSWSDYKIKKGIK